jgi:hypothetical protein
MDILFIDHLGIITKIKNPMENVISTELKFTSGKYTYNIIKIKEGIPLKLKFCNTLINFSGYVVKTNKNTNKILDIKIKDIIDADFLINQTTLYDSDESSDIEYDICDKLTNQIC